MLAHDHGLSSVDIGVVKALNLCIHLSLASHGLAENQ